MSILIRQKLVENAKIEKFKCDILSDFQTLCREFSGLWLVKLYSEYANALHQITEEIQPL